MLMWTQVGELKGKLELLTGINSGGMTVELKDPESGAFLSSLEDDNATLEKAGSRCKPTRRTRWSLDWVGGSEDGSGPPRP